MRGIFAKLTDVSLAKALAPIGGHVQQLDWAVDLYSGPLRFPYYLEDEPESLVAHHHWVEGLPMGWFQRGFLPKYADSLIVDEQSSYLGFDRKELPPEELARRLEGCGIGIAGCGIGAPPKVFELMTEYNLLLILWVVEGWWEAYSSNARLIDQLQEAWDGKWVDSSRWQGTANPYPG